MTPLAPASDYILIAGYYGFGNTGDEAILSAIVRELRIISPNSHLIVQSGNPPETAEHYGVEAFPYNDPAARLEAIERSRLVIIGGGGLFFDYWGVPGGHLFSRTSGGMSLYFTIALYAALRRIPVMLWALGAGPLRTEEGQTMARAICRLAGIITVRDAHSRRELEAIGVSRDRIQITADPVFSKPPLPATNSAVPDIVTRARHGNAPLIGVCLRHWDFEVDPAFWEAQVAAALDLVAMRTGASFVFIPFQACGDLPLDDVATASRVRAAMSPDARATILPESLSVAGTWTLIGSCDSVLAMRFHAGVAAATRAVPFVTLGYDPKVTNLCVELGLPDRNIDIGSVNSGRLAELLEATLWQSPALTQTIRDAGIRLGIRGRQTALAARAILDGTLPSNSQAGEYPDTVIVRLVANAPDSAPEPATEYEPLITVVLPVWNHSRYIGDAIRSVLTQTWRNLELIVVDDGSDEDLSPELEAAIAGDPRAAVVRRDHEGLPRTLSTGFHLARGEYFNWTSADNIMKPDALASMARFLLHHPETAMVYANFDLIDDEGNALIGSDYRVSSQRRGATNELWLPHAVETLGLVQDNFLGPCFLYRGETGRLLGDYDASRVGVEDYEYWLRMSISTRIEHFDSEECLYSYRVHDDTLTVRQADIIVKDVANLIKFHEARVEFYWQAFHIAIVVDPQTPGLGRTAANLAYALRRLRHVVTEFDLSFMPEPGAKTIAICFGDRVKTKPGVFCFHWRSAASSREGDAGCRMLRSSKRIPENRWPLLPASRAAYQDLVLCTKARGTAFPLWGLPEEPRHELFVYLGLIDESFIDWEAVEDLVRANPEATILFISTDPDRSYDPRIRIPSAVYVGFRAPADQYPCLSRASLLIAPFADVPGVEEFLYDVLMAYLAAGKPIVATPVIDLIGFADIPHARVSDASGFGEAAQRAMRIATDPDLATAYMESKSHRAFAESLLMAANHEICPFAAKS